VEATSEAAAEAVVEAEVERFLAAFGGQAAVSNPNPNPNPILTLTLTLTPTLTRWAGGSLLGRARRAWRASAVRAR
jgi:hypothetical protein